MTETEKIILAKLTLLEFTAEIMLANELSSLTDRAAYSFLDDFLTKSSQLSMKGGLLDGGEQAEAQIEAFLQSIAERFCERIDARRKQIRAGKAQED